MTESSTPFDQIPADWDLSVLDHPVLLQIPEQSPEHPDPHLIATLEAVVAALVGDPTGSPRLAELAHTGVLAVRTSTGVLEIHETLLGWTLKPAWGTPDLSDLAAAARLRAHRLARERRHDENPS